MSDVTNLSDTIVAKSDQLNADDLISGTRIITVTAVKRSSSPDQPVSVHFEGDGGRPYKPCKTMRKVLIFAWGENGADWVGRRMALFVDPEVKFGGVKVGGIRISRVSHIDSDIALGLNATKGRRTLFTIKKLPDEKPAKKAEPAPEQQPSVSDQEIKVIKRFLMDEAKQGMEALKKAWSETAEEHRLAVSPDGTCPAALKKAAQEADAAKAAEDEQSDEF